MANPLPARPARRRLAVLFTAALTGTVCLLALASPAAARVVIVPGEVQGGSTETFAIRVANERTDVDTTSVELRFPTDLPIPLVAVTPAEGWTATIETRPLDEPITVGDQQVDEAVASIRWEGGRVAPGTFEQFLVTAGPLPASGQLVFAATEGYSDGSAEEFTDPAPAGDAPKAPTINLVGTAAVPGGAPVAPEPAQVSEAPAAAPDHPSGAAHDDGGHGPLAGFNPIWMLLVAGLLAAVAIPLWQRRAAIPADPDAGDDAGDEEVDARDEETTDVDAAGDAVKQTEAGEDAVGDAAGDAVGEEVSDAAVDGAAVGGVEGGVLDGPGEPGDLPGEMIETAELVGAEREEAELS